MNSSDLQFKVIGVVTKPQAESVRQTLHVLFDYLTRKNCTVILDKKIPDTINNGSYESADRETLGKRCDLVIAVGGDGTILNAARSLAHAHVPLVGINVGRLGFLADISPDELESSLDEILSGIYREEQRFLLDQR